MNWQPSSQRALAVLAAAIVAATAWLLLRPPPPVLVPVPDDPRVDVRVDLNRADLAALEALPGVGPALAARIADHRRAHGPFRAIDDLAAVPGVGPATVGALRELVTVGSVP